MYNVDKLIFNYVKRDIHKFKYYINRISDINILDKDGWSILHYLTYDKQLELIKYVIELGANVNILENIKKSTPLHISMTMEFDDVSNLLLEYGADPHIKNMDDLSPLDCCKNKDIVRLIKMNDIYGKR